MHAVRACRRRCIPITNMICNMLLRLPHRTCVSLLLLLLFGLGEDDGCGHGPLALLNKLLVLL